MVLVNVVDGRSFCCIKISERNRLSPILLQTRGVPLPQTSEFMHQVHILQVYRVLIRAFAWVYKN
jgi:hypothetical protein